MLIMVFDVPAETGGALTILNDFYQESINDHKNNYIFVISKPLLRETSNVKVYRYPWIKKSWVHRLYFDYFFAPKLVENYKPDAVLSLQNIIIPKVKIRQTLYVHNALPFIDKRFSLKECPLLWVYQNIISKQIVNSIQKADKVIVQTAWMKNACADKAKVKTDKITVKPPSMINIRGINNYFHLSETHLRTFFYPANASIYKNHDLIVTAALILKNSGINDYKIVFTLSGNENRHIAKLYKQVKKSNLPINFIGLLSQEEVYEYYTKSVLIFPSFVETIGLPLLEAKLHQAPVFASDMPFSHEILDNYTKVKFFDINDAITLAHYIGENINDK